MQRKPSFARFSEDKMWWWDGQQWHPAFTPDMKWQFDGVMWQRTNRRVRPPHSVLVLGLIWIFFLAAWIPATAPQPSTSEIFTVRLTLVSIVALGTAAFGFLVAHKTQIRWIWAAATLGTAAQLVGYVAGMLEGPQPNGTEDIAAGAGLDILFLPTSIVVLALLWIGAGLELIVRVVQARRARN
ncbi:MAG TPA: hypothetical protein VIM08_08490 [Arthrobacter sp.]